MEKTEDADELRKSIASLFEQISSLVDASETTYEFLKTNYIDKLYSETLIDQISNLNAINRLISKCIKSTEESCTYSHFILSLVGELLNRVFGFTHCTYRSREANKRLYLNYVSQLVARRSRGLDNHSQHRSATQYLYCYRIVPSLSVVSKYGASLDSNEDENVKLKNAKIEQIAVSLNIFKPNLNFCIYSDDSEHGRLYESEGQLKFKIPLMSEMKNIIKIVLEALKIESIIRIRTGSQIESFNSGSKDETKISVKFSVLKEYNIAPNNNKRRGKVLKKLLDELGCSLQDKQRLDNFELMIEDLNHLLKANGRNQEHIILPDTDKLFHDISKQF